MDNKLKFVLLIFIGIFVIAVFLFRRDKEISQVCFQEDCFRVELAETPEEREKGLMLRPKLAPDRGMLFIFEEVGEYPFWMKNCYMPLDIIWLNENKEVVFVSKNCQPCPTSSECPSINPEQSAKYVLEINGGMAEKIGLMEGVLASFE